MRVSAENVNSGWVGMGWWVSGLLIGAYNITHQPFLVHYYVGGSFIVSMFQNKS